MDWKTFIADLVDSLAWPAAVAFVAFLLRGQLRDLLKRVRKARYGQAEAEFADSVDEGEALAEQVPLPPPEVEEDDQRIRQADPRSAVLEAWIEVEDALQKFASRANIGPASPRKLS